jgi:hypothetical protein
LDALTEFENHDFDVETFRLVDFDIDENGSFKGGNETFVYRIPWNWCKKVLRLPGSATQVGLVIWYYYGLRRRSEVILSRKKLEEYGISRSSIVRGLSYLEKAILVKVRRVKNSSPRVIPIFPRNKG